MNYKTIKDLSKDIKALVPKLPVDLDLIVGIPRSGLLVGNLIALYLNLPFTDVESLCEGRVLQSGPRLDSKFDFDKCKKVLVVDDTVFAGHSMRAAKSAIRAANLPYEIYYAAIYVTSRYHGEVDFWHELVESPRFFEWNISTHDILTKSCVDLDGVLCRDPTEEENDDGDNYRHFIANVEPIFKPSVEIGWIVTCRLEKYRDLTEKWLKKYGIQYRNLIMMNFPDKKARIASKSYSTFKAEAYKSADAALFIESSLKQAQEIVKLTGKEVLCIESNQLIRDDTQYRIAELQNIIVELQDRVLELQNGCVKLRSRIEKLQGRISTLSEKNKALRASVTFQVGKALVSAARPSRATIALPFRLWRIYRDYRARKRQHSLTNEMEEGEGNKQKLQEFVPAERKSASWTRKATPATFIYKLLYIIGRRLVDRLTLEQRRFVAKLLPPGLRNFIERILTSGQRRTNLAERLAIKLWNLGFIERALADLYALLADDSKPRQQKQAAWELSLWYVDQYSEEGAVKCLELLPKAMDGVKNPVHLRRAAVLEIESLDILGDKEAAKLALRRALKLGPDADLFLAAANLESSLPERMIWVNKALALHGLASVSLDTSANLPPLHCLRPGGDTREHARISDNAPKVTVIMPAYNAEGSIEMALGSVLAQTWDNLEVLVVDDCSEDATAALVEKYMEKDSRVRLIRLEANRGTYVARNVGLKAATGDFVTCHDTDDWSHPQKIETQVLHLIKNPSIIGNFSRWTRVTPELTFRRRGNRGFYIQVNYSSFMFRRQPVVESVGYWDSVRFAADVELRRRVRNFFGNKAVKDLKTGPLAFAVQSEVSLTGHSAFGYHGRLMGIRKEYHEGYTHFHITTDSLYLEFPQETRPFPVPEPMWPIREAKRSGRRHFDVILASDFRLRAGATASNVEEIKAQRGMGLRTGLIQMSWYDYVPTRMIDTKVRELIDGDRVQMVVYGEKVSCDLLILKYPPILQERQRYIPDVKAEHVIVIMIMTPYADYGPDGVRRYDIRRCAEHLKEYFGEVGVWYPIGPWVRETLYKHHAEELAAIPLADEDWVEIIDVNQWRRTSQPPRGQKIRIGRHSRDDWVKWPADRHELLSIYPDSSDYEVHILGGARAPRQVLGRLPKNWHVLEFGTMDPRDFLSALDVFVYYTHPYWVESFGRTIFEAMAVGVPAILPYSYQELFQEAAVYAEPSEVKLAIDRLMNDDDYYDSQVERAWRYVESNFGYSKHVSRLSAILGRKL